MSTAQPIITAPHPTLRTKAKPVEKWSAKLEDFAQNLAITLKQKDNPPGVGLAAPQIDQSYRIFCTYLTSDGGRTSAKNPPQMRTFINPEIVQTSSNKTLGEDPTDPILEGCLSIPLFYGPVPRWEWVEVEFDQVKDGKLVRQTEKFEQFAARVMQHEHDHLNGRLFTDYILEFDLPLYEEQDGKLKKIKNSKAKKF